MRGGGKRITNYELRITNMNEVVLDSCLCRNDDKIFSVTFPSPPQTQCGIGFAAIR